MYFKKIIPLILISASASAFAERSQTTINDGWFFRLPSDASWQMVNIPHTYNADAYQTPNYYRGKAFYQKSLNIDTIYPDKRYFLKFDAASKAARVKVNGNEAGEHSGGYSAFTFDVTDFIKPGANEIEVEVDNGREDIAPISADFTFWGGLYRDAWLLTTGLQHFDITTLGAPGVYISTKDVSRDKATVSVVANIKNDAAQTTKLIIESRLYAPDGREINAVKREVKAVGSETSKMNIDFPAITKPELWSPENPALYTVKTSIYDANGKVLDNNTTRIGLRWFSVDPDKGFFLNGEHLKLRGVNRHQDEWPVGVALNDEAHRRDMKLIKDFGANFVRLAHYPQDDAVLDACDELGLLVWEEIPVVNVVPDTPGFSENCQQNLREMICQHYNHPSVVAWGYMNEILLRAPGKNTPEWLPCVDRTIELEKTLEKIAKDEDPSRLTVTAFHHSNDYIRLGMDMADITGWNLYQGWYGNQLDGFQEKCISEHTMLPDKPIFVSEWGAGSDRRIHSTTPRQFDFSTEYQHKFIEHYLPFIEETPWIVGGAYWNFIDFNVAERQESMQFVNNKGLFYNNRQPKDVAYYFKATWTDEPVIRIASRDHDVRMASADGVQNVKIYSNMPSVELFIDGKSVGTKDIENFTCTFTVPMAAGEHNLQATGNNNGVSASDVMQISVKPRPILENGDELAVNLGNTCEFTSDVTGLTWLADQSYTQGSYGHDGGNERSSTSSIDGTVDDPLFQCWREGDFSYIFDAAPGTYELEVLSADTSKPKAQLANLLDKAEVKTDNQACFRIVVNGQEIEDSYVPAENERFCVANRKRYVIDNKSNNIIIDFIPVKTRAIVAALKLRKLN